MKLYPCRCIAICYGRAAKPRGDIVLGFCHECAFIYNIAFDAARLRYNADYENSLHFSPRFQAYAENLASRLIRQYDLHEKDIIEIGCGKGDFLALLCKLGGNRGVGFDPSLVKGKNDNETADMIFVQDVYSERYSSYKADFICSRHTLEHVPHPKEFLTQVRRAIDGQKQTVVFFEVPNALFTLRDLAIWDIIYEHCSYFSAPAFFRLFAASGFEVKQITEIFEGQFLCLEAMPATATAVNSVPHDDLEKVSQWVVEFPARYRSKIETWRRKLEQLTESGKRAVVWGAGSKGVTFLNALANQIDYVVDINPRKHHKFVAGTGQKIVPPEFMREYRPAVIIVMNPIYLKEIRQIMASMSMAAETLVV
ncbi:MAG: class I SAM-dependent methyltransferase [bacterium]